MAAPAGTYRGKSIFVRNLANTTDIQHLVAILHSDKATMCARFYLDGLLNSNSAEGDGVTGYCLIGSANYSMHAGARYGNLRVYDGGDCIVFNDAGLNTLGWCGQPLITNRRVGSLAGTISYKSAYYVYSDSIKWQYNLNNTGWATPYDLGGLGEAVEQNTIFGHTDLFRAGDEFEIRGQIVNAEGTFIGVASIALQVRVRPVVLSNGSYPSAAYASWIGGSRIDYYTDSLALTFGVFSRVFSNDPELIVDGMDAPAQSYSDGTNWYVIQYVGDRDRNEIVLSGPVAQSGPFANQWPPTDPAYETLLAEGSYAVIYFGNTNAECCDSQASGTNGIIPYRVLTNKKEIFFTDSSKTTTIPFGWYSFSGDAWIVSDGVKSIQGFACMV